MDGRAGALLDRCLAFPEFDFEVFELFCDTIDIRRGKNPSEGPLPGQSSQ
jgi:hypothetical protein